MKKQKPLTEKQLALLRDICAGSVVKPGRDGASYHTVYALYGRKLIAGGEDGFVSCREGKNYLHILDNPAVHPPAHLECRVCFQVKVSAGICTACGTKQDGDIKPTYSGALQNGRLVHSSTLSQHDKHDM